MTLHLHLADVDEKALAVPAFLKGGYKVGTPHDSVPCETSTPAEAAAIVDTEAARIIAAIERHNPDVPPADAIPPQHMAATVAEYVGTLAAHPAATIFPLMDERAVAELAEDIKANGLRHPIWRMPDPDSRILDGRNRLQACALADEWPRFETYRGADPVGFVVSLNLHRRHLTESQRAMAAAKIADMAGGARTDLAPIGARSDAAAAKLLNVGERSVERAKAVIRDGAPELVEAVAAGAVSVSAAAAVAETVPVGQQAELVARGETEIVEAARRIRQGKADARRTEKLAKLGEIAAASAGLPSLAEIGLKQRYAVLLADPPWQFENPPVGDTGRSVENHYPTMSFDDLAALPVAQVATATAVLYLWSTNAHLATALRLIEAWGFEYRANIVWDKEIAGLGYWVRNRHELLLIASRGGMPAPPEGVRPDSVVRKPRARHSEKPPTFHGVIERCFPDLPKLELFARTERNGWDQWGNQLLKLSAA